jgi:hypothetical protein
MKHGDTVRGKEGTVGKFVQVDAYTGYVDGKGWRTPDCLIRDIKTYWKVVASSADDKNKLPFG